MIVTLKSNILYADGLLPTRLTGILAKGSYIIAAYPSTFDGCSSFTVLNHLGHSVSSIHPVKGRLVVTKQDFLRLQQVILPALRRGLRVTLNSL